MNEKMSVPTVTVHRFTPTMDGGLLFTPIGETKVRGADASARSPEAVNGAIPTFVMVIDVAVDKSPGMPPFWRYVPVKPMLPLIFTARAGSERRLAAARLSAIVFR